MRRTPLLMLLLTSVIVLGDVTYAESEDNSRIGEATSPRTLSTLAGSVGGIRLCYGVMWEEFSVFDIDCENDRIEFSVPAEGADELRLQIKDEIFGPYGKVAQDDRYTQEHLDYLSQLVECATDPACRDRQTQGELDVLLDVARVCSVTTLSFEYRLSHSSELISQVLGNQILVTVCTSQNEIAGIVSTIGTRSSPQGMRSVHFFSFTQNGEI